MGRSPLVTVVIAVVLVTACGPMSATATPSPTVMTPTPSATPTAAHTVAVDRTPTATATPRLTPRVGGCTSPTYTSRELLDRYFSLTTTGDVAAVIDCFAKRYRDQGDIQFSAERWANAGKLASLEIRYVDTVKGCDRYAVQFQFVVPDPGWPAGFSIAYSIGPEAGTMRIFDGGTALASAEVTRVSCG